MPINYPVPFFSNTPDDTHCFQAAMKMVYEYFKPDEKLSFAEWDKISAKVEGLYTWQMAGLLWMAKDFYVTDIETFDYKRFIEEGGSYLHELLGDEVAENQIKNSDIEQEKRYAREFLDRIRIDRRAPAINDITVLLDKINLVVCNVNARVMNNKEGYAGHFVVVKGYDEEHLIVHDPGLPAYENRKVPYELFMKAWAYPNKNALNLMAFQLK